MKLDINTIKHVLQFMEEQDTFSVFPTDVIENLKSLNKKEESILYHIGILIDADFINASSEPYTLGSDNSYMIKNIPLQLTYSAHNLLESLNNDTFLSKAKTHLGKLGLKGLESIPSLILQLIKQGLAN